MPLVLWPIGTRNRRNRQVPGARFGRGPAGETRTQGPRNGAESLGRVLGEEVMPQDPPLRPRGAAEEIGIDRQVREPASQGPESRGRRIGLSVRCSGASARGGGCRDERSSVGGTPPCPLRRGPGIRVRPACRTVPTFDGRDLTPTSRTKKSPVVGGVSSPRARRASKDDGAFRGAELEPFFRRMGLLTRPSRSTNEAHRHLRERNADGSLRAVHGEVDDPCLLARGTGQETHPTTEKRRPRLALRPCFYAANSGFAIAANPPVPRGTWLSLREWPAGIVR